MKMIDKIYNNKQLNNIEQIVFKMKKYEPLVCKMDNTKIREEFEKIKHKGFKKELPYLLCLIGRALKTNIDITPYEQQFIGAISLYQGYVSEMKTGEGKSIVSVMASILLSENGSVHIATVNDYLAMRDYENMKSVFETFGLKVGINLREKPSIEELYQNDIIYTSSSELIFDYLRNELLLPDEKIDFPFNSVIIDEIDYVLLDNANSMFSISSGMDYMPSLKEFQMAKEICKCLVGEERDKEDYVNDISELENSHYVCYDYNKTVYLTDKGLEFIEKVFNVDSLIYSYFRLYRAIIYTLEANIFYLEGRDYIIKDNKVVLISQANGRIMIDSQLENDLHTAIEVKSGVPVTHKHILSSSLSYQIFFTKYRHMVGMSGTVYDARGEFENLFKVPTIYIPTHKSNRRIDHPDMFFETQEDKYKYLIDNIVINKKKDQPILIIASNENESIKIYELLKQHKIGSSNLLNAQSEKEEAELVRLSGTHDNITVSTNMSGRGTDIILDEKAEKAGGLFVVGLSRNVSKRIDNQARGRAGRQGIVGESIFLVSFEDEIWDHMDYELTRKAQKYVTDIEAINSPKNRISLERCLDKVQDGIQVVLAKTRETLFTLDGIIEKRRIMANELRNRLQQYSPDYLLVQYINSDKFNIEDFKKSWNEKTDGLEIDFDNLEELVAFQHNDIGNVNSQLLFKQLVNMIIEQEWLLYKKDIEYVKYYVMNYTLSESERIRRFVNICVNQFEQFNINVMENLLGYFLTAKVQECA